MNKSFFILLFFSCFTFFRCSEEIVENESRSNNQNSNDKLSASNIIDITSYGTSPTSFKENLSQRKLASKTSDEFTNAIEVESSESVILTNLHRYIFPGSLLRGNSIQDLGFVPIAANINPVTVSLSIPSTKYKTGFTMERPSLSSLRSLVNSYLKTSDFSQQGQFSYSIEEFSSFDELKVAFGSNVDTRNIFRRRSTSENHYGHLITTKTGLYIKFFQTSFTLDMDIPNGSLVKDNNFDNGGVDPVYVSSISYGRMGILTVETDEKSEEAIRNMNTSFSKLFVKGNSYLTEEEKKFINSSRFQLYTVGGNGSTAVQSFQGYEAFIKHISQGSFTKDSPGIPIFCSYSNLKDNSPVKTRFKFDVKKKPLYAQIVYENINKDIKGNQRDGYIHSIHADVVLKFYESRTKKPTIASPYITFNLSLVTPIPQGTISTRTGRRNPSRNTVNIFTKQNTLGDTSIILEKNKHVELSIKRNGNRIPPGSRGIREFKLIYTVLPDDKFNYIPLN